jgi:hypothetical protein
MMAILVDATCSLALARLTDGVVSARPSGTAIVVA